MSTLSAPEKICIYTDEDRPKTIKFLKDVQEEAFFYERNMVVDLRDVQYASAAASTLMFAVVNSIQLLRKDANSIKFLMPVKSNNPKGHHWIVGTGLAKALLSGNVDRLNALAENERHFQSAVRPHEHYVKTVVMLNKQAKLSFTQFSVLSSAISEAMLNVLHHAYKRADREAFVEAMGGDRWWQCAWFNPVRDEVVFIICDLGIGVGQSFRESNEVPILSSESDWIQSAFSFGGTRFTNSSERGNGSEEIKRPIGINNSDNESLLVFSGRAMYKYTSDAVEAVCSTIPEQIPGTLVQWSLKRG